MSTQAPITVTAHLVHFPNPTPTDTYTGSVPKLIHASHEYQAGVMLDLNKMHGILADERRDSAIDFLQLLDEEGKGKEMGGVAEIKKETDAKRDISITIDDRTATTVKQPHIPRPSRRTRRRFHQVDYELRMAWRPIGKRIAAELRNEGEAAILAEVGIPPVAA